MKEAAFWKRVDRSGGPAACWEWSSYRDKRGYGSMRVCGLRADGKMTTALAHRYAWTFANGPIPEGLCICHKCDNPPCCNPAHLFAGTHTDNMRDMVRKGRLVVRAGDAHWTRKKPELLARGDRSGARTHPEQRPRGERHGTRTKPESIARGARHWSATRPECIPRGADHWSTRKPECCARGDRNGLRKHPESVLRGEKNAQAKLTADDVSAIRRESGASHAELARAYGVSAMTIRRIRLGLAWKHLLTVPA